MIPHKPFDLLLDEVIEANIDKWIEDKERDAEQLEFEEVDEI